MKIYVIESQTKMLTLSHCGRKGCTQAKKIVRVYSVMYTLFNIYVEV
jgi:hypothetical protein